MSNLYLLAARVMSGPVHAKIEVTQLSKLLTDIYGAIRDLVTPIALIAMGACGVVWIISSVYMAGALVGMITNGIGGNATGAMISNIGLM